MHFISFREATGQSFRLNCVTNKEGLIGALTRINWVNCRTSAALALAAGDNKSVEAVFTRKLIAAMPVKDVDRLCGELIQLMYYAMRFRRTRNRTNFRDSVLQDYALSVVPEAISRLVTKCSKDVFISLADLLLEIYKYPEHLNKYFIKYGFLI